MTANANDIFTRDRLQVLSAIVRDHRLKPFAVRVATLLIVDYLNRKTGDAWPSHETIAKAIGATKRGVKKALDELVAAGYVEVTVGGGRRLSNRYRFVRKEGTTVHPSLDKGGTTVHPSVDRKEERPFQERRNHGSPDSFEGEPIEERGRANALHARESGVSIVLPSDDSFERFIAAYPTRQGGSPHEPARREFEATVRAGADPEVVIRSTELYAAVTRIQANEGSRFIPQAARWLREGRWKEDWAAQMRTPARSVHETINRMEIKQNFPHLFADDSKPEEPASALEPKREEFILPRPGQYSEAYRRAEYDRLLKVRAEQGW